MIRNLITALYTELALLMVWWCWRPPRLQRIPRRRVRHYQRHWAVMGGKRLLGRTLVFGMRLEVRVMLA
jgi:hypothetical protein